jgi:hypothetical protein
MRLSARSLRPSSSNRRGKRRSDQSSRRMLGRRAAHAVRREIIPQRRDLAGNRKRGAEYGGRRAYQELAHASCHENAFVAVDRSGSLRGTAGHVASHLIGRCGHRHIVRYRRHRRFRRHAGHHRPSQRSQYQPCNHGDGEQPAYGDLTVHIDKIPQNGSD